MEYKVNKARGLHIGGKGFCPVGCIFCCRVIPEQIEMNSRDLIPLFSAQKKIDQIITANPDVNVMDVITGCDFFGMPDAIEYIIQLCNMNPKIEFKIVTTAVFADAKKVHKLADVPNISFTISLNTFDQETRNHLMHVSDFKVVDYMIRNLKCYPILSDMGDVEILKRDIEKLETYKWADGLIFRRLDWTRRHNKVGAEFCQRSVANFERSIEYLTSIKYDVFFWMVQTELAIKYKVEPYYSELLQQIQNTKERLAKLNGRCLYVTPDSSYTFWKDALKDVDNVDVVRMENKFFGGSIIVAGLMTLPDVDATIHEIDVKQYSLIALPFAWHLGQFRDCLGNNLTNLSHRYGVQTEFMGRVLYGL